MHKPRVKVFNHFAQDSYKDAETLTVKTVGAEGELRRLLDYIRRTAAIGHTFNVVVDPGDSEHEKSFGFDGDGAFRIEDIS